MLTAEEFEEGPQDSFDVTADDDPKVIKTFFSLQDSGRIERATPKIRWHVDGVLPIGGVTILYGKSGSKKSFVARDLAAAVARGEPWCGRKVEPTPVLFVAAEGAPGLGVRVRGYRQHVGLHEELPWLLRWIAKPVRLANAVEIEALLHDIAALRSAYGKGDWSVPVLLVIDTLGACLAGDADENSSKDMQGIAGTLMRIAAHNVTVMVVHHTTKDGRSDRGHGSLRDRADLMIEVVAQAANRVTLDFDKRRDGGPRGTKIVLSSHVVMLPDGESTVVLEPARGEAGTAARVEPKPKMDPNRIQLLDALRPFGAAGARSGEWEKASGLSHGTYNRLRTAVAGGEVIQLKGRYVLREFTSEDPPKQVPEVPPPSPSL